jgi:endo-1,4-beta-xylanase
MNITLLKKILFLTAVTLFVLATADGNCQSSRKNKDIGLKDALKGKFLIGVAMNSDQITGKDTLADKLIAKHFNSIVAENCMKSGPLQPKEGEFNFTLADQFVKFGEEHKMYIVGHTLIWHSQTPRWFFVDDKGNTVTREVLIERMRKHITTVVSRYKGRVNCWDVVNEAINDDGTWRNSPFYKIIGKDFIKLAFQFAHEADPKADLDYNDYSMYREGRRNAVVTMIKELKADGIKITAVGMQGHLGIDNLPIADLEKSIDAFAAEGVKVMFTELDVNALPSPGNHGGADVSLNYQYQQKMNPYPNGLPDSVATILQDRYVELFRMFIKHKDQIKRINLWGLTDGQSWLNNWPVRGRTNYPLLFDRNYQPKPIVETIIKMSSQKTNK